MALTKYLLIAIIIPSRGFTANIAAGVAPAAFDLAGFVIGDIELVPVAEVDDHLIRFRNVVDRIAVAPVEICSG